MTGLVQGVTELFPVSSLGHNVLLPALIGGSWAKTLNVSAPGSPYLAFIVGLHVATAIAMIAFFWRDWLRIVRGFFSSLVERRVATPDQRLAWMIILGTIPVGIVGVLVQKEFMKVFAKPELAATFLAINGLILLASERMRRRKEDRDGGGTRPWPGGPRPAFDGPALTGRASAGLGGLGQGFGPGRPDGRRRAGRRRGTPSSRGSSSGRGPTRATGRTTGSGQAAAGGMGAAGRAGSTGPTGSRCRAGSTGRTGSRRGQYGQEQYGRGGQPGRDGQYGREQYGQEQYGQEQYGRGAVRAGPVGRAAAAAGRGSGLRAAGAVRAARRGTASRDRGRTPGATRHASRTATRVARVTRVTRVQRSRRPDATDAPGTGGTGAGRAAGRRAAGRRAAGAERRRGRPGGGRRPAAVHDRLQASGLHRRRADPRAAPRHQPRRHRHGGGHGARAHPPGRGAVLVPALRAGDPRGGRAEGDRPDRADQQGDARADHRRLDYRRARRLPVDPVPHEVLQRGQVAEPVRVYCIIAGLGSLAYLVLK